MQSKLNSIIIMLLLTLPLSAFAANRHTEDPSKYQDIKKIMNDVRVQYPELRNNHIRIIIGYPNSGEGDNAEAGDNQIRITYSLAQVMKRDHNLAAAVIGHELYHIASGTGGTPKTEQRADYEGVLHANKAGYNGCQGATTMLTRFAKDSGWNMPDPDHGSPRERLNKLPCGGRG